MRVDRFKTYFDGALGRWDDDLVTVERTPDDHAVTLRMSFQTGASVHLKIVRTAASGGDRSEAPERIVEGDAAPEVLVVGPPTLIDGKIRVRDIELYLRELILAGGSREIARVRSFSSGEASGAQEYGLAVDFHSGATVFVLFVHTLPSSREPSARSEYAPLAAI